MSRHVLVALSIALAACTGGAGDPTPPPVADPLLDIAEREGTVDVVVQLAVPRGSAASFDGAAVKTAQRRLMSELGPGARVVERFGRRVPQIVLRVTPEALQELRGSRLVVNIARSETDTAVE